MAYGCQRHWIGGRLTIAQNGEMTNPFLLLPGVSFDFEPGRSVVRPSLRFPGENGDTIVRGAEAYFPSRDLKRLAKFLQSASVVNDVSELPYNPFVNLNLTFQLTVEDIDSDGDGDLDYRVMLTLPTGSEVARLQVGIGSSASFREIRRAARLLETFSEQLADTA